MLGGQSAKLGDGGQGLIGSVDGGAGDENIRPGLSSPLNGLRGDSAIDLDAQLQSPLR